ncbi:MAG: sigma-70 family RNA polymerase sigma factor, partial [Lachnospiraceae bacterium]|nr:sigma-70 family RNA polymerase sigma factor [Lachnospiraceae bacterium]
ARAEDAVQDAFLKLMKGRVYFEDAASDDCKKYIVTVIRHSAIDIYNRKKREQEIICFLDGKTDMDRLSASENREEGGGIKDLISVLPSRYYDVVDCLAVKNLSVRETAKRLGISEENVRKRFERAKKRLKKEWNVSA